MAQSEFDNLQAIRTECDELLMTLEIYNPKADNVFLNQKMTILKQMSQFNSIEDIAFFLKTPVDSTTQETNSDYLKASNGQFFTQAKLYFGRLQDQLFAAAPTLYQMPIVWLGLLCMWHFIAVLDMLLAGALIVFGLVSLMSIYRLNHDAISADLFCKAAMYRIEGRIEGLIKLREMETNLASLEASIQNTAPVAETLLADILHADYAPETVLDEQQTTPLHTLLIARWRQHSLDNTVKMKSAIGKLQQYKYYRNQEFATPLLALRQSDPYQLRPLFKLDHMLNIGSSFAKIDAFLDVFKAKPKETNRFLLLEGPSGTGKSASVVQYLGVQKNCVIQEWVVGTESDQWRSQLEGRITTTFQTIIAAANTNPSRTYILYLDKIDSICPAVTTSGDQPTSKTSSYTGIAEQFQRNIENLRKHTTNVLVVGTTTSALSLSRSMRNLGQRILFALPTYQERLTLLTHFFIEKRISTAKIQQIAQLTDGWPPQAMVSLVNEIVEITVDDVAINGAYDRVASVMENDFKQLYSSGELYLPRWTNETDAAEYQVLTPRCIEQCFNELRDYLDNQQYYTRTPMNVLLSGPPGGGKTTAVRNFSLQSKVVFVLVKSGIMEFEMTRLLERANLFDRVIMFIDEIDQCTCLNVLQTQMDGFKRNNTLIIGATNHPELIALRPALWSRFKYKIEVPALDNDQRGQYISWIIHRELQMKPNVSIDNALRQDLAQNCPTLTQASAQKDMRRIGWDLQSFFGQKRSALARGIQRSDEITLESTTRVFS